MQWKKLVMEPLAFEQVELAEEEEAVSKGGSETATLDVAVQPFASVISTFTGPAQKPVALGVPWPVAGAGVHK